MKKGFTLIEIIISIGLIVLIGAIFTFSLLKKYNTKDDTLTNLIIEATSLFISNESDEYGNSYIEGLVQGGVGVEIGVNNLVSNGYISEENFNKLLEETGKNANELKILAMIPTVNADEVIDCEEGIIEYQFSWKTDVDEPFYLCNYKTEKEEKVLYETIKNDNTITEKDSIENSNETIFATTEDNYGTSYYFGGSVKNNYLNFAGMCWRILRIDGANNVKIILEDKTTSCENSDTTNIGYNSFVEAGACTTSDDCKYIDDGQRHIDHQASNGGDPYYTVNIYIKLLTWFAENIESKSLNIYNDSISYADLVISSDYCSDRSQHYNESMEWWDGSFKKNRFPYLGMGQYTLSLGFTANPSLKCDFISSFGSSASSPNKNAKLVNSKIALITADELVFATDFYQYNVNTTTAYFNGNTYLSVPKKRWWTMTLAYEGQSGWYSNMKIVIANYSNNGTSPISSQYAWKFDDYTDYYFSYTRPVITLNGNLGVTGTGVKEDAYVPVYKVNKSLK